MKRDYQKNEKSLIKKAARVYLTAFNELVLKHQNIAYYHAYALLGDHDLAEDVTQESFIKAFHGMNAFRGGSFRSWLLTIVTNSALVLISFLKYFVSPPFQAKLV